MEVGNSCTRRMQHKTHREKFLTQLPSQGLEPATPEFDLLLL
jgi:hypothetical protein